MFSLENALREVIRRRGSDLHIAAGEPPLARVIGELEPISSEPLTEADVRGAVEAIAARRTLEQFAERGEADFRHEVPGLCSWRVNCYRTYRGTSAAFRAIPTEIPKMSDLGLPPELSRLAMLNAGLILFVGATGSGKSTATAALVDYANAHRREHIITIEDPIEFTYRSRSCLVSQREVGEHTGSFPAALRVALREDPDIIVVGEMRDAETVRLALEAAETGHLVFATLHTRTAAQAVDRIISIFPEGDKPQIRAVLADALKAVLSVTLMKRADQTGRVQAMEVLLVNGAVRNLIREGKTHLIPNVIQTSRAQGMRTMDDCVQDFLRRGVITRETAERYLRSTEIDLGQGAAPAAAGGVPAFDGFDDDGF